MYMTIFIQLFVISLGYIGYRSLRRPDVKDLILGDTKELWLLPKQTYQQNLENDTMKRIKSYYAFTLSCPEVCTREASNLKKSFFSPNIVIRPWVEGIKIAQDKTLHGIFLSKNSPGYIVNYYNINRNVKIKIQKP